MRSLVRKLGSMVSRLGGEPAFAVAVFGKHPGWNDHMQVGELRGESSRVRATLYDHGIARNIDSGAWEQLDPSRRLAAFGHVFAARLGRHVAAGRISASRDRVGRSDYPLIVAATWQSLVGLRLGDVMPVMATLEREAAASPDPTGVAEAVARAESAIDDLAPAPPAAPAPPDEPALWRRVAAVRPFSDDREALLRFAYALDRDVAPCRRRTEPAPRRDGAAASNCHARLRVPRVDEPPEAALARWISILEDAIVDTLERWVVCPIEGDWIDLWIGAPDAEDLFTLRANTAAVPCVTTIPFTGIDDAFRGRIDGWIGSSGPDAAPSAPGATSIDTT